MLMLMLVLILKSSSPNSRILSRHLALSGVIARHHASYQITPRPRCNSPIFARRRSERYRHARTDDRHRAVHTPHTYRWRTTVESVLDVAIPACL